MVFTGTNATLGIASLAEQAGAPVVGGDLSSAPPGVVVVSVYATRRALAPLREVGEHEHSLVRAHGVDGRETHFCLTTSPAAFPGFELHGAFRSREVTGEAFFALMRARNCG